MSKPRVYADFHNTDRQGQLRLNCVGTVQDLARQRIELKEGVELTLYSEELAVEGHVHYSTEESLWVAVINWAAIKEIKAESDLPESQPEEERKRAYIG